MKQTIVKKLILWFAVVIALATIVFVVLMQYNEEISEKANADLGALFMTEIMLQTQDHFETVLDVKYKEVKHIANWTKKEEGYRDILSKRLKVWTLSMPRSTIKMEITKRFSVR